MSDIKQELDRIRDRISDPSFLANKGLSNEVGIHVFCYDPADELIVRDFVSRLKAENGTPYHIKECDLYEIFLKLLEDKRVLKSVDGLEEKRGKEYLLKQLQKIATPEALLEYMKYEPHEYGDVLFLTGVGKIFPFMRSHKMLDSMPHRHVLSGIVQRAGPWIVWKVSGRTLLPGIQPFVIGGKRHENTKYVPKGH